MENQSTYIKQINIEGLWNRYDVEWTLHPDVNILIGENGSGKSTILTLLRCALPKFYLFAIKKIDIESFVIVTNDGHTFKQEQMCERGVAFGRKTFGFFGDWLIDVESELLKTFDNTPFGDLDYYANNKPEIVSSLDRTLEMCIADYNKYQVKLSKKASKKEGNSKDVFEKLGYFKETINKLFDTTHKKIDEDSEDLDFLLVGTNKKISAYSLSSGEKQFLILLLTVLCQDEKPYILLLDEPEISLHIRWQYELIEILRTLNPNCQLIIASHSTSMFTKGWRDKIFDMLPGEHGRTPILKPIKTPTL
jgi:predicted ATP-binding protein involved in virulence